MVQAQCPTAVSALSVGDYASLLISMCKSGACNTCPNKLPPVFSLHVNDWLRYQRSAQSHRYRWTMMHGSADGDAAESIGRRASLPKKPGAPRILVTCANYFNINDWNGARRTLEAFQAGNEGL